MPNQLTPRSKRLLVIAMVTPWLFLIVYFGAPLLNSQKQHLRSVEAHIERIAPQWESFRKLHPGFQEVKFFAYTGGDGMFGAWGPVPTDEQVSELRKFMEGTMPPRPVFLKSGRVVGTEYFESLDDRKMPEEDGGASRPR